MNSIKNNKYKYFFKKNQDTIILILSNSRWNKYRKVSNIFPKNFEFHKLICCATIFIFILTESLIVRGFSCFK